MKGKILFVVGGLTGYVLGTRAGRERYEQIKKQWLKVWNAKPVQAQVSKVEDFAKARVSEIPAALWTGVKGVANIVAQPSGTPGQKLDRAIDKAESTVEDVQDAIDDAVAEKSKPAASTKSSSSSAAAKKPAARKPSTAAKPKNEQ
ncbi:hypothetical protein [Plantibacter sp. YIM 135347]|jgi:hypothetical protein|uniref:hypothetical protein n=1 Tax=Plantibacter sp. YIM 135347 TaxID=3423919 RepID=UPI003D3577F7